MSDEGRPAPLSGVLLHFPPFRRPPTSLAIAIAEHYSQHGEALPPLTIDELRIIFSDCSHSMMIKALRVAEAMLWLKGKAVIWACRQNGWKVWITTDPAEVKAAMKDRLDCWITEWTRGANALEAVGDGATAARFAALIAGLRELLADTQEEEANS